MTELELMRARRDEYIAASNRDLGAKREAEAERDEWKRKAEDAEAREGYANGLIAKLQAQLAKAREDTARRCAEIAEYIAQQWREVGPEINKYAAGHIGFVASEIREEFSIDAAREKGGK